MTLISLGLALLDLISERNEISLNYTKMSSVRKPVNPTYFTWNVQTCIVIGKFGNQRQIYLTLVCPEIFGLLSCFQKKYLQLPL